jgi:hypothetical protein
MARRAGAAFACTLLLTPALASAGDQRTVPAECAFCPTVAAQAGGGAAGQLGDQLCFALVGALGELDVHRQAFHRRPRYIDLFPTVYWNVTEIDFARLAHGEFAHPVDKLEELVVFFDAYKANRLSWETTGKAEPHWLKHYKLAAQADQDFGAIGQGSAFDTPDAVQHALGSAVSAHVDYDLPRAIRAAFEVRQDRSLTFADLAGDYARTDATIDASAATTAEIFAAIKATSTWKPELLYPASNHWLAQMVEDNNATVIRIRRRAWAVAAGPGPLPTRDAAQPVGDHAALEREGREACAA